jgi:signal transduction histidine kinase/ligand-binding sensor domain-containing protein/CheY-like chemotaxis protein
MKLCISIFILVLHLTTAITQVDKLNFKRISTQDGLSNSWVRCIYHDERGYIWFGTSDGLSRFDGYDFKIYRPESAKKDLIGDVNVNDINIRNKDELWVCTDLGIYIYNYKFDSLIFNPVFQRQSVQSVLIDSDNNTWFGTNHGLFRMVPGKEDLDQYIHKVDDNTSLSSNFVNTVFQDSESNLWIGNRNGLNFMKKGANSFINYYKTDKPNSLPGNYIASICEDAYKHIWIGTQHNGLAMAEKDRNGIYNFKKILDGHILNLLVDYQNNIWVGKDGDGGLDVISQSALTHKPVIKHYCNNPSDPKSLSDNSICYIYEDRLKDIWIGTLSEGVNYYSKREKKFNMVDKRGDEKKSIGNNHVNAFFEEENFLWIGTEGGLDRYNKKTGTYTHFRSESEDPGSLGGDAVYAIFKDSRGNLWVGAWSGGLNLFNYHTEKFKRFLPDENNPGSISNSNVYSICEDKKGFLWIGTLGGGLCRFDYKTGSFNNYAHDVNDLNSLSNNSINHVIVTSDGKLFASNYTSLIEYNYANGTFVNYPYVVDSSETDGKHIIGIFEDSKKNIWIATNVGLELFDKSQHTFTPYKCSWLPARTVQGIIEDSGGNLWISTTNGLSKLLKGIDLPENPEFLNYTINDGLSGNEFIKRAAYKNSKGVMFFGSSKGFTYFHPDSIFSNEVAPHMVLSEFKLLFSSEHEKNKYKSSFKNINAIERLDLSYKNSNFVISFAALNFLHPEKNRYQYKLEGYDDDWIDAGNQRSVAYTNIQPGRYTFYVKGSNNDGVWCKEPKKIQLIIHPPWWKTLVFRIALILAFFAVLYSIYRIRISILKRQNAILEKKVKDRTNELTEMNTLLEERQEEITIQNDELEQHRNNLENLVEERTAELVAAKIKAEESDRLKSSFMANMSHEIRTPMNAIYGFSGLLDDENIKKEDKSRYIEIINENCESLLVLIDDILDISRIEVDHLIFTNEQYVVDDVLNSIERFFRHNNEKNINIEFVNKKNRDKLMLYNDKVRFRQVVTNLLNNAYKFTDTGDIKFGYEKIKENIRFFVSDTGIGIDSAETEKIFDSFYKIENREDKIYRGTGLGLAICRKLVEMMGGEIWVESVVGKGSVFNFTLPNINHEPNPQEEEKKNENKKRSLKSITILVAEDTPTNYELVRSMLNPFGANIIWVQNGLEAVEFVKYHLGIENFIILMDIKMPLMDGYEAMRQIKSIKSAIPVIAVTAYAQKGDKEKMLSSGFDDYLAKPIKIDILLNALVEHSDIGNMKM